MVRNADQTISTFRWFAGRAPQYHRHDGRGVNRSPILSLEEATVVSQGRKPLGTGCVPRAKSPEGAADTSIVLSPLRGLAIGGIPVQGLAPLAKNCRPVPGLGGTRSVCERSRMS